MSFAAIPFLLFFCACLSYAAFSDLRAMRLSNTLNMMLAGGFVVAALAVVAGLELSPLVKEPLWMHGLSFVVVMVVSAALFFTGLFGGGDAKMLPATALWVGLTGLPVLLMVMGLAGGVLAVAALVLPKTAFLKNGQFLEGSWLQRLQHGERSVPYGVAIAMGGLASVALKYTGG